MKRKRHRCYTCKHLFHPDSAEVYVDGHRSCGLDCALRGITGDGKFHCVVVKRY